MIIPPLLKSGDRVAIVGTAKVVKPDELITCIQTLKDWNLQPELGPHLYQPDFQFAATDAHRLADLQAAIDDPGIRCILFARGGYGTLRILDQVDFTPLLRNPKWLIGFSDLTPVLVHLFKMGIACIHGPMGTSFFNNMGNADSMRHLKRLLMEGGAFEYRFEPSFSALQREGTATGPLLGGCLSLLSHLMGTPTDFDTRGCIFFIEDIDEYLYHHDRLCVHLRRGGKFDAPAAVICGGLTGMKDNESPFGKSEQEIVADALRGFQYPTCYDFPVGHWPQNFPLPVGVNATLDVRADDVCLRFEI
jgi:muramoyltetrapeptide carboxypeptidase